MFIQLALILRASFVQSVREFSFTIQVCKKTPQVPPLLHHPVKAVSLMTKGTLVHLHKAARSVTPADKCPVAIRKIAVITVGTLQGDTVWNGIPVADFHSKQLCCYFFFLHKISIASVMRWSDFPPKKYPNSTQRLNQYREVLCFDRLNSACCRMIFFA